MEVWKIIFLSKWGILRFHVNLAGCNKYLMKINSWKIKCLVEMLGPLVVDMLILGDVYIYIYK